MIAQFVDMRLIVGLLGHLLQWPSTRVQFRGLVDGQANTVGVVQVQGVRSGRRVLGDRLQNTVDVTVTVTV